MKADKELLIGIFAIILIVVLAFFWKQQKIVIATDSPEYDNGGILRAKIRNYFLRTICFSSCYPYYLEKGDGAWRTYLYQDCNEPDLVENCIEPGQTKAFEILLPTVSEGLHRIAVPICENCQTKENFQESNRFYSNQFELK